MTGGGEEETAPSYMDQLGHFGRFQAYVYIFCIVPGIFTGAVTFSNVFLLADPKHRFVTPPNLN